MKRTAMVFPVRFATHNTAVQTTTRELSTAGVYVCCLQPPEVGARLDMKLYLPGLRDGVLTQAVVRELAPPGGEAGFWADFVDPPETALQAIAGAVERRERAAVAKPIGAVELQPMEDPRRAFPRLNLRFAVRFATVDEFVLEYAANISAGGVFVATQDPPPLHTVVRVEMDLPGSETPVLARGRVVHRLTAEDAIQRGTLAGMGVQFVEASDEFRRQIDAVIDRLLDK